MKKAILLTSITSEVTVILHKIFSISLFLPHPSLSLSLSLPLSLSLSPPLFFSLSLSPSLSLPPYPPLSFSLPLSRPLHAGWRPGALSPLRWRRRRVRRCVRRCVCAGEEVSHKKNNKKTGWGGLL